MFLFKNFIRNSKKKYRCSDFINANHVAIFLSSPNYSPVCIFSIQISAQACQANCCSKPNLVISSVLQNKNGKHRLKEEKGSDKRFFFIKYIVNVKRCSVEINIECKVLLRHDRPMRFSDCITAK